VVSTAVLLSVTASSYYGPSKEAGSPGVLGFVMTFAAALVVVLIALAMTTSLRRVNRRAELEGRLPDRAPHFPERRPGQDAVSAPSGAPTGPTAVGGDGVSSSGGDSPVPPGGDAPGRDA